MPFSPYPTPNPNGNPACTTSFQAHYVIPFSVFNAGALRRELLLRGLWNGDDFKQNGIWLPTAIRFAQ